MSNTDNFESKVDQLILACQELKRDNLALKKRESALIAEKNQLVLVGSFGNPRGLKGDISTVSYTHLTLPTKRIV